MEMLLKKAKKYLNLLGGQRATRLDPIADLRMQPCGYKQKGEMPDAKDFSPFDTEKDLWGNGPDTHAWFSFSVDVPSAWESVFLAITSKGCGRGGDIHNPQFIAYVDGVATQGLDCNHTRLYLPAGHHDVLLYAYTGMWTENATLSLKLYGLNIEVEKLWYDIKVPVDSLEHLETYSGEYRSILHKIDKALSMLDLYKVPSEAFFASVHAASEYMDREFYGSFCGVHENAPTVVGIGHTHIDCAYLWTLKQTREKVQRSFSTVIQLMRRYPEYKFMSSQAFLYQNLKEEEPQLYEEVRRLIREGRWECEGAMWVEADCNLSSGESLVRQVLYGKRFFKEEFGVDNRVLWLPDVFGYSAALPQILKKSGVDWFVTSKISWNEVNQMPHDTFLWQGIDGTRINTYFLTAQDKHRGEAPSRYAAYVAHTTPAMVAGTYDRYAQKELNDEVLLTFGWGDGGGGPTEEHLEMGRRLAKGIPGTPAFKIDFAGNLLSRIEKRIEKEKSLPVWQGELYLEFHRGTYTTQHKNKKNNRRSEELYLSTELYCSIAKALLGASFPKAELHRGWEMLLTNQFHDIIPGSSINEVYRQCDIDYKILQDIAEKEKERATSAIAASLDKSKGIVICNPNPTVGSSTVRLDGVCAYIEGIPAKGYARPTVIRRENTVALSDRSCENKFYRLTFDEAMNLSSLYDKRNGREVLRAGGLGNALRIYADYPERYDAWEWKEYTLSNYTVLADVQGVEQVQDGARAGIRIARKHFDSTIVQTIWLYEDIDRIDFDIRVDWKERHQAIKAAFDINVNASRATYEIQYGTTERPTHKNTSWDRAKFEVCAHRFADLSDGGYGVSLLNDCKYGHDIHDGVMTLTLLRSPTEPDPKADLGVMECTYALLPHAGTMDAPTLYRHAYALNSKMTVITPTGEEDSIPASFSMLTADRDNILCEVVKEAEDSAAHIFRLFECNNTQTTARLTFGFPVSRVALCDMGENVIRELPISEGGVTLPFGAFEIHTLLVE